ncbi:hypothetical protein [Actinomycetospora straminea]|uniref:Uncharacterized protein n=1 Tax=Actinomycetospora straminea TaxID=663607 RepID=A0ABP9E0R3_9PSEU|nr:hypothetical protein [Actinomycetospora straminea]MDD7930964.1 hypothetical protein [Actinomycetospora straminea]
MFRRSTTTTRTRRSTALRADVVDIKQEDAGPRHTRRAKQRRAVDDAALQARLDRVHRRLAEVGAVRVTGGAHVIGNEDARRDPLTRPFAAVDGVPAARRSHTAPLPRPA